MATQQKTRTVFNVTTKDGKWIVTREGRPAGEFDSFETRNEAIARARDQAQRQTPSQVIIHRADGTIENESTYTDDPFQPRV